MSSVTRSRPDLFADLDEGIGTLLGAVDAFADRHRGQMYRRGPAAVAAALAELAEVRRIALRLDGLSAAAAAADLTDEAAGDARLRVEQALDRMYDEVAFVDEELCAIDAATAVELLDSPEVAPYHHFLGVTRALGTNLRPTNVESALAAREPAAAAAWTTLYHRQMSLLRPSIAGKNCSVEEARRFLEGADQPLRVAALTGIYDAIEPVEHVLAHCFDTLVSDRLRMAEVRGFATPRRERDLFNELPAELVDGMLTTTEGAYAIGQRWFALKADLMGLPRLGFADMRAPVGADRRIPYTDAIEHVVTVYEQLSPEAGALSRQMFAEGRVDAEPRAGKQGGGFCRSCGPDELPWVHLSYYETVEDVLCLAHEMGHALHFAMSGRARNALTFDAPAVLGEVPPAFVELLVYDRLIAAEQDPTARRWMAAKRLDGNVETLFLTTFLTRFEEAAHRLRAEGTILTGPRIRELWLAHGAAFYGPQVDLPERWGLHWALVPHLVHEAFSSYAYTFARLVALVLHDARTADADVFGPRFAEFLGTGGSAGPLDQLAPFGIERDGRRAWESGLAALERMLGDLARER
jgi:oligoendopeptidase F